MTKAKSKDDRLQTENTKEQGMGQAGESNGGKSGTSVIGKKEKKEILKHKRFNNQHPLN